MTIIVKDLGDTIRISGAFTNSAGTATDPTVVYLTIRKPSGALPQETYSGSPSAIEKDSTGNYHRDIQCDEVGDWFAQWEGTGTVQAVEPVQWVVKGNGF